MNAQIEHNKLLGKPKGSFDWLAENLFRAAPNSEETQPMSDGEFFGSLTLIVAALIVLRIFFT